MGIFSEHVSTYVEAERHSDHGVHDNQWHTAEEPVHVGADQNADQVRWQYWQGHEYVQKYEDHVELQDIRSGLLFQVCQQIDQVLFEHEGQDQCQQTREYAEEGDIHVIAHRIPWKLLFFRLHFLVGILFQVA